MLPVLSVSLTTFHPSQRLSVQMAYPRTSIRSRPDLVSGRGLQPFSTYYSPPLDYRGQRTRAREAGLKRDRVAANTPGGLGGTTAGTFSRRGWDLGLARNLYDWT